MSNKLPGIGEKHWGVSLNNWLKQIGTDTNGGLNVAVSNPVTLSPDDVGYTYFNSLTNKVRKYKGTGNGSNASDWEEVLVGSEYECTVGNSSNATYTTVAQAIAAGKTRILITDATTETTNLGITDGIDYYIRGAIRNLAWDLGSYNFGGTVDTTSLINISNIGVFGTAFLVDGVYRCSKIKFDNCLFNSLTVGGDKNIFDGCQFNNTLTINNTANQNLFNNCYITALTDNGTGTSINNCLIG